MFWFSFLGFWLCVAILAYGIRRMDKSRLSFWRRDFSRAVTAILNEKDEFVDKDYYDKKNLFK